MKYFKLWALALFLKMAGASWDASYHFKFLFEKYSFPHLLNATGFFLGGYLLWVEWVKRQHLDTLSRNIITGGYILFLIGIPLDFSYHVIYGIDLTTWSPTHFVYYVATTMMIIGAWRGYFLSSNVSSFFKINLHLYFCAFLLESILFPCIQQENGAISYYLYIHHQSIASDEILQLISNPYSQIFAGVPDWLYPVYSSAAVSFFTVGVYHFIKQKWVPFFGLLIYLLFRLVAKGIFFTVDYPTSYIPISLIVIPLLFALFLKHYSNVFFTVCSCALYFLLLYFFNRFGVFVTPSVSFWMIIPICFSQLVFHILVHNFQRKKAIV